MDDFDNHFLAEDDGNFELLLNQLNYVHRLLSDRMSDGFSYFGHLPTSAMSMA